MSNTNNLWSEMSKKTKETVKCVSMEEFGLDNEDSFMRNYVYGTPPKSNLDLFTTICQNAIKAQNDRINNIEVNEKP